MDVHTPPTNPNLKRPRRTLNRLAAAFLALGIGGLAQTAFNKGSLWDGALLYLLSIIIFVLSTGRDRDRQKPVMLPPYRGLFMSLGLSAGWRLQAGVWLLAASVATSFGGWFFFDDADRLALAWQLYGVSLALFLVGVLFLTSRYAGEQVGRWAGVKKQVFSLSHFLTFSPAHLLVGILLLALALRLWNLGELPFGVWYDEAEAGLQARRWLAEATYKPAFYAPINISGLLIFLYSLGLRFISDSVFGLRLVSAFFGVGGVLVAYLFGRELEAGGKVGRWAGEKKQVSSPAHLHTGSPAHRHLFPLTLAFFVAVMRWDINFSRIAMTGVDTPFFEFLTLFFLTRLLRRGGLRNAAFAGLTLGFGLSFYTAFRLFVLALGVFAALGAIIWPQWWQKRKSGAWWGKLLARGLLLALAVWIALMPVAQFAVRHPDAYWLRVSTTSITTRRDDPNLGRALRTSAFKHLAMFHIAGDKNGRHNLPGQPMLDPVMGVLMMLGLGVALANIKKPANLFFLILLPVSLLGGILSLDFEAPQSLRSIAVIPAVAYFAALPIQRIGDEVRRLKLSSFILHPSSFALFILLPSAFILFLNARLYFGQQANDFAVWNAFSTAESISGRKMAELGPGYDFYLSPFLANHPSVKFLSPDIPNHTVLSLPNALPVHSNAARPATIFIHPDDGRVYEDAQRLYPGAAFETAAIRPNEPPTVHIVTLTQADIASVQGVDLRYWAGSKIHPEQVPIRGLRVSNISVDWASSPIEPPFTAEWEGILYAGQYGAYQFILDTPGEAILELDGTEVFSGTGQQLANLELARGNHTLHLLATARNAQGQLQLRWQPPGQAEEVIPARAFYHNPVTNNGLLGKYYPNPNWQEPPAFTQIDALLDIYFHLTPLPRPYSVEWVGQLEAPVAGLYNLTLRAVSGAQLFLDGNPLLTTIAPNQSVETAVSLLAGLHNIKVRFLDAQDRSRIHLYWIPPGGVFEAIPGKYLWPPMGAAWQPDAVAAPSPPKFEVRPLSLRHLATLSDGLIEPRDIAVDLRGRVYVADTGLRGVAVFSDSQKVDVWTETLDGPFEEPLALVVDQDDFVWALDSTRQWVYRFDSDGNPVDKLGGPEATFYHPRGLALLNRPGGGQMLAVVNTGVGQLNLYALDGASLGVVGSFGDGPGQLNEPVDLIQDEFGFYYITEGYNVKRWQRLDAYGKFLASWGAPDAPAAFDGMHLAWAPDGSVLMTNSLAGQLRRYSPVDGTLLDSWPAVDSLRFQQPVGIFMDAARKQLFVTDVGTGEVYLFGVDAGE